MSIGGDSKFIGGGSGAPMPSVNPGVSTAAQSSAPTSPFGSGGIYGFGANNISNAGAAFNRVGQGGAMAEMMPTYMNPYTNDVINRSLTDLDQFGQTQLNHLGANATQAGAFGGARHGIAEGTLLGDINKNAGDMSAGLRHQGFTTAAGLAGQDVAQSMDAARSGADLGFGAYDLGRTISGDQQQAGQMQQMLQQMILDRAGQQFQQTARQPQGMLDTMLSALGMSPLNNARTQTQQYTPGLFDYLSLGAGMASSALGAPRV